MTRADNWRKSEEVKQPEVTNRFQVSVESKVVEALKTKIPELTQSDEHKLEIIQENAYHLHTHPPYFIKYVADGDRLGKNEIWVNQTILPKPQSPHRPLFLP